MRGFVIFCVLFIALHVLFAGAVCSDGWASPSIGSSGACSHHGGVSKAKNIIILIASIAGAIGISRFTVQRAHKQNEKSASESPIKTSVNPDCTISNNDSSRLEQNNLRMKISSRNDDGKIRCPKCKSEMKIRTARKGKNAGGQFYGCSRYPKCRGTLAIIKA